MKYQVKKNGVVIFKGEGTCLLNIDDIEIEIIKPDQNETKRLSN